MELTLTNQTREAMAFAGAVVDAEGAVFVPARAAALAGAPEITEGGRVEQEPGPTLLKAWFERACKGADVEPGNRLSIPYAEVEDPEGAGKRELRYFLPYQKGNQSYNPAWIREEIEAPKAARGKEKLEDAGPALVRKMVKGAPYLWHDKRMRICEVADGVLQLDNPDLPPKVVDVFSGRTDDLRRVTLRMTPDVDHKVLSSYGCYVDQAGMGSWREAMKAQAGSHAHLAEEFGTSAKGWMRLPGCEVPYYIHGDQVTAPAGCPALHALARGGTGPAPTMGVQTSGSFQAWKDVIALVLRNADAATQLGFCASSALFPFIKEMEAGLWHWVGGSGSGKTTMLKVAASLIGSADGPREAGAYIFSWNSTENAIEAPLAARSDAFCLFDELYELPQNVNVFALLYRINNGRGKSRMNKEAEVRAARDYKTQTVSTGEGSFASRVAQDGHEYFPEGLSFRVMELHVDTIPFWSDVRAEGDRPAHGAYQKLVNAAGSSAPTPQGQIIEAIELELKRNHGHFWKRWISQLQKPGGAALAAVWFGEERAALAPLIPKGANPVYVRRTKHVAAAMAGLRGILAVCEFDAETARDVLERARRWSRAYLWPAGIEILGGASEGIYERFRDWLVSHESDLLRSREPLGRTRPAIGWIDGEGACSLPSVELRKVAAVLKIDCGRLEKAISGSGWAKERKRHPRGGRASSPLHVWTAAGFFAVPDVPTVIFPPAAAQTSEEAFGA